MLSIGDFARYAGVSIRMLRHYDATGLLVPAYVDPDSGYRFYEAEQLDRANALVALKDLGFTLAQVGVLLDRQVDAADLRRLFEERRRELSDQIERDRARLVDVERRLRLMEGTSEMDLEFSEKELPAITLVQLTDQVREQPEVGPRVGPMFEEVVRRLGEAGQQPMHPGFAWYAANGDVVDIGVGFPRPAGVEVPGTEIGELAAEPRAVTAVYRGEMARMGEAWQALGQHIHRAGLEFAGPCREVYLQTQGPQETWVTELQQPVSS